MKGKESDEWYYIVGSIPFSQEKVTGEHMGGQIHQGDNQAGSLGSSFDHEHGQASHGSETERDGKIKRAPFSNVHFSTREDRAIIDQFRQGVTWQEISNHDDILNQRNAHGLRSRFRNTLEPKMNPSEAKRLNEERAQNME